MNTPSTPEEEIFEKARAIPDPAARSAYLEFACEGDSLLRERVEKLLSASNDAEGFFQECAAALNDLPRLLAAMENTGERIGSYKLLQKIGEGGCGLVYLAAQEVPFRRKVALKIIKLGMDTDAVVARFDAERQALAMMDHPNIAKIFDAGATESGRPYFVMEFVEGVSITRFCDEQRLGIHARLNLFVDVCHAVQHAHQKGVIHRDLKPTNILVSLRGESPVPKVIDFGIAKAIEGRLTEHTLFTSFEQFLGTPAYMSPEQAVLSRDIDTRSDIYSLGVLLFELLTGKTPFDSERCIASINELRQTILEEEVLRPSLRLSRMTPEELSQSADSRCAEGSQLIRMVRGDLDWVVMKCLEKDRTDRYASAVSLINEIEHHLKGEPVLAHPLSRGERALRWARRRPLVAGLGAMTALLLLAISIGSPLAALRIQREREKTENLLSTVEIQRAEMCVANDQAGKGIAFLARALRQTPADHRIGKELVTLLSVTGFLVPAIEPLRFGGKVYAAEFSHDGQRIVAASYDGTGGIYDAATGRLLVGPFKHKGEIRSMHLSPDGRRVATASWDHTARIWDSATGLPLSPELEHQEYVWSALWSPDGRKLVTASYDGCAKIWDSESGEMLQRLEHSIQVAWAEFSPDGRFVVTASWDHTAQLWDAATGEKVGPALRHGREVWMARFSPDGQSLVTVSWDQTARIWKVPTGEPAFRDPLQHNGPVVFGQFTQDGQKVLTASWDGTARLWDARDGKALVPPMRHGAGLESADVSPDGQLIVTACLDGTSRIWDVETGQALTEPLRHERGVEKAHFSPDGRKLLTSSDHGILQLWEIMLPPKYLKNAAGPKSPVLTVINAKGLIEPAPAEQNDLSAWESIPAPPWVPALAESIVGRKIEMPSSLLKAETAQLGPLQRTELATNGTAPLRAEAFLQLRAARPWNEGIDVYSRWARWLLANPIERPLTPVSTATMRDYFENLLDEQSIPSLREAARLQPTNPVVFARLAMEWTKAAWNGGTANSAEADWASRRALALDNQNAEAWRASAENLRLNGDLPAAADAMKNALERQRTNAFMWLAYGEILESAGHLSEAEAALSASINSFPPTQQTYKSRALQTRARIRRQLNRLQEAAVDNQLALNIPPRAAGLPSHLIDLSDEYNANLDSNWHEGHQSWTLNKVPHGRARLAGVEFDIRGIIQLASPSFNGRPVSFPAEVKNIRIDMKASGLHFLHATGWASLDATCIGWYRVHYSNGSSAEIPILYGTSIRDWGAAWTDHKTDARAAVIAWQGDVSRVGGEACLYRFYWENPNSNLEIASLDFESALTQCAPFLVALTAEPFTAARPSH